MASINSSLISHFSYPLSPKDKSTDIIQELGLTPKKTVVGLEWLIAVSLILAWASSVDATALWTVIQHSVLLGFNISHTPYSFNNNNISTKTFFDTFLDLQVKVSEHIPDPIIQDVPST